MAVTEEVEEVEVEKEMDWKAAELGVAEKEEVVMEEEDLEVKVEEHRRVDKVEEKEEMAEEVLEEEVKVQA